MNQDTVFESFVAIKTRARKVDVIFPKGHPVSKLFVFTDAVSITCTRADGSAVTYIRNEE